MKNKIFCLISSFLLLAGLISAQSLAELAKKEKERRQSLGEKKGRVVTNEDLTKIKRRPALETGQSSTETSGQATAGFEQSLAERGTSDFSAGTTYHSVISEPSSSVDIGSRAGEVKYLEEAHKKAQEYVELLTLKLNALWQEFYSLDDMTPRDQIQQAIAETFLKLQKAQEEEEKLRKELEKYLSLKKANVSSIWIR
ncbi:MAG: hypothetical protein N3B16_05570 [Candidatus Aminicenantes bacterium]|nr:hypothetical protein [Candidatus Aminicenantes bacterium]